MGLPLTTAETFPCLPLNNTGFPDSRSPISPLHAFLIAKAPRVTWANRLARPRILRLFCCDASMHSFFLRHSRTWHLAPGTVKPCRRIWQALCGHCQQSWSPTGGNFSLRTSQQNRQVREYDYSQRALRGSYDDKWLAKSRVFFTPFAAVCSAEVPQRFPRRTRILICDD